MSEYPELLSHEENLSYYDSLTTESLRLYLPHAELDVEEARRRLRAVREILARRGELSGG